MAEEKKRLYRGEADRREELHDFEQRYGKEHGREVYGEVVGKVAREQAAERPSGVKVEHVRGHIAFSDRGRRYIVRPHETYVHAERHGRGHHGGRCPPGCREGKVAHRHRRGRGSSRGG